MPFGKDDDKEKNGEPDPSLVAEHGEGEAEDIHEFQGADDAPGEDSEPGGPPSDIDESAPQGATGPEDREQEGSQLADGDNIGGPPGDEQMPPGAEGAPDGEGPGELSGEGEDAIGGGALDGDGGWQDGDDFDGDMDGDGGQDGEGALGEDMGVPGEETQHPIRGQVDGSGKDGTKVSMKVEPHDDGDGHMVHFHDDVSADLRGDADYQHHATEWSKHQAGYHISKQDDPERSEAHRHAANLHARIGNALHAGSDTKRERGGGNGMPPGMDPALLGVPGEENGFGSDEWNNGEEVAFPDVDEPSPGNDALGNEVPAKPDQIRNNPMGDTTDGLRAKAKSGGGAPPGGAPKPPPSPGGNGGGNPFAQKSMRHTLRKAGPFIGPRGGKWADAKHTIPWKEGKGKKKTAKKKGKSSAAKNATKAVAALNTVLDGLRSKWGFRTGPIPPAGPGRYKDGVVKTTFSKRNGPEIKMAVSYDDEHGAYYVVESEARSSFSGDKMKGHVGFWFDTEDHPSVIDEIGARVNLLGNPKMDPDTSWSGYTPSDFKKSQQSHMLRVR